jgi:ubiquinone/menaquinone biosynthesis C-methylase UbiE
VSTVPRRGFNSAITRFWSFAAPVYDAQFLQRWVYQPAQDEVIAQLREHGARRIADIGCGTGMLAQAQNRSSKVWWMQGPAEQLPFADGTLDAVVSTSAFHFFDQPAALRDFHRVLAPGGLAAVATISITYPPVLDKLTAGRSNPAHNPPPGELRTLFTDAGFTVAEQHPVARPLWTKFVTDVITVGVKDAG